MSLIQRLKRRLGYDTTMDLEHSQPVREYTVTHLNGNVSTVRAHGYKCAGGFAKFYTENKAFASTVLYPTVRPSGRRKFRALGSVAEIGGVVVGETGYRAVIDTADGSVVEREVVNPVGESDE